MNQSVVAIITGPNNFVLQGKQIGGGGEAGGLAKIQAFQMTDCSPLYRKGLEPLVINYSRHQLNRVSCQ